MKDALNDGSDAQGDDGDLELLGLFSKGVLGSPGQHFAIIISQARNSLPGLRISCDSTALRRLGSAMSQ
jgi:hypothetical protein